MSAQFVDRAVVKRKPVVFGSGIPLFGGDTGLPGLKLKETKVYDCGIVLLRYNVSVRGAGPGSRDAPERC